jgi:chemotaxis response regulator CheB
MSHNHDIIVVGASAGGVDALRALVTLLPADPCSLGLCGSACCAIFRRRAAKQPIRATEYKAKAAKPDQDAETLRQFLSGQKL